ncbi:hypothetical protein EON63_23905 [archaeon]|nr:MAG: hypothetical protein EON63_23905 [archaeon]
MQNLTKIDQIINSKKWSYNSDDSLKKLACWNLRRNRHGRFSFLGSTFVKSNNFKIRTLQEAIRMPIKAPKARACYICGRQTLLPGYDNHVMQCRALFEKREAQKPPKERRQCPPDPMSYMNGSGKYASNSDEYMTEANAAAMKAWESTLSACHNCGRSFLPDKLAIHQRSCTASNPARRVNGGTCRSTDQYGGGMGGDIRGSMGDSRPIGGASGTNSSFSATGGGSSRGNMKSSAGPSPMNNFPEYVMLNKCANCGRNFNEVSYAKHVKVCAMHICLKYYLYTYVRMRAHIFPRVQIHIHIHSIHIHILYIFPNTYSSIYTYINTYTHIHILYTYCTHTHIHIYTYASSPTRSARRSSARSASLSTVPSTALWARS